MENKKKFAVMVGINEIYTAMRLARKRGKKPGESYEKELFEVMEKKKKGTILGSLDDGEMIRANLRENGIYKGAKILDIRNLGKE